MKKLTVNFETLKSTSENITKKNNELIELAKTIKNANDSLKAYWEGQDASKYSESIDVQLENLKNLTDNIAYMADFLMSSSNALQEMLKENTNMIG